MNILHSDFRIVLALIFPLAAAFMLPAPARAEARHALVIGNGGMATMKARWARYLRTILDIGLFILPILIQEARKSSPSPKSPIIPVHETVKTAESGIPPGSDELHSSRAARRNGSEYNPLLPKEASPPSENPNPSQPLRSVPFPRMPRPVVSSQTDKRRFVLKEIR